MSFISFTLKELLVMFHILSLFSIVGSVFSLKVPGHCPEVPASAFITNGTLSSYPNIVTWIPFSNQRETYFFNSINSTDSFEIMPFRDYSFVLIYQINASYTVRIWGLEISRYSYSLLNTTAEILKEGNVIESGSCFKPILEKVWVWYTPILQYIWSCHNTSDGNAEVAWIVTTNIDLNEIEKEKIRYPSNRGMVLVEEFIKDVSRQEFANSSAFDYLGNLRCPIAITFNECLIIGVYAGISIFVIWLFVILFKDCSKIGQRTICFN